MSSPSRSRTSRATAASLSAPGRSTVTAGSAANSASSCPVLALLGVARGHDQQHRQVLDPAREVAEERDRARVDPVQVVDDQHHRAAVGHVHEKPEQPVQELEPGLLRQRARELRVQRGPRAAPPPRRTAHRDPQPTPSARGARTAAARPRRRSAARARRRGRAAPARPPRPRATAPSPRPRSSPFPGAHDRDHLPRPRAAPLSAPTSARCSAPRSSNPICSRGLACSGAPDTVTGPYPRSSLRDKFRGAPEAMSDRRTENRGAPSPTPLRRRPA